MGFNSAFKGLNPLLLNRPAQVNLHSLSTALVRLWTLSYNTLRYPPHKPPHSGLRHTHFAAKTWDASWTPQFVCNWLTLRYITLHYATLTPNTNSWRNSGTTLTIACNIVVVSYNHGGLLHTFSVNPTS